MVDYRDMLFRGWQIVWLQLQAEYKEYMEILAVIHFVFLWIVLPIISIWFPFYILFYTRFWWTMILYALWTCYDWNAPRTGSRPWNWYKTHVIWRHFADYFPLRLVKTAELSPDRNYIIGSHPHGVLSIGAFTSMVTNATGFQRLFPGLTSTVLTLNGQFYFPFRRDAGLALGGVEASKESLIHLLKNPGKGRAIAIVVGGATEALDAHPGNYDLNILSRRGFCRYAIKYGADLIPMFNFGENDVYEQCYNPKDSTLRTIQQAIKNVAGFCPPLLKGRGIFNENFGLLPHRRPITSVVGAPIRVERNEHPSDSEVDRLHSKYCAALVDLFEKNKYRHNIPAHVHLNLY